MSYLHLFVYTDIPLSQVLTIRLYIN